MSLVFSPCAGAVIVSRAGCSPSDFLKITVSDSGGGPLGILTQEFIVQGVTLEMSGNYQFLHTVNDFVYFYSFGDKIGSLSVTGVGFLSTCPTGNGPSKTGANISKVYEYYNARKTIARGGRALVIVLAPPTGPQIKLHGFLTGVKLDIAEQDFGPVGYWVLRFDVLPDRGPSP